ncbi:MAG: histidine phosphatase family protein [Lachnospiraceae bacterium]|nr:histidine phosphatase family protein [Lachnospiraceae bacterium]
MKLTLVRHGETDWNKESRIQGITDIPLNDYGRELAIKTKEAYDELGIRYDVVYSSPLLRAKETADIITPKEQTIILDDRIREMSFGKFDGSSFFDIKNGKPGYEGIAKCFNDPPHYVADETAESYQAMFQRLKSFLDEIHDKYVDNQSVLVVAHGCAIRGMLTVIGEYSLEHYWDNKHKNLCHTEIEWEKDQPFHVTRLLKYYYDEGE